MLTRQQIENGATIKYFFIISDVQMFKMEDGNGRVVEGNEQAAATTTTITTIVLLLCGLPGAGKSSLIAQWLQDNDKKLLLQERQTDDHDDAYQYSISVVEYDQVQESLFLESFCSESSEREDDKAGNDDRLMLEAWRKSRQKALQQVQDFLTHIEDAEKTYSCREGSNHHTKTRTRILLLDDNFFLRSMRKQIHRVCQSVVAAAAATAAAAAATASTDRTTISIHFGEVWLDTPLDICYQRNQQRAVGNVIPEPIIARMSRRFEVPDPQSKTAPSWEHTVLHLDGTRPVHENVTQLDQFVQRAVRTGPAVQPSVDPTVEEARLAQERAQTAASWLHQADQYLRSCVQAVASIPSLKSTVRYANVTRKQVLTRLQEQQKDSTTVYGNDELRVGELETVKDAFLQDFVTLLTAQGKVEETSMSSHNRNTLEERLVGALQKFQ